MTDRHEPRIDDSGTLAVLPDAYEDDRHLERTLPLHAAVLTTIEDKRALNPSAAAPYDRTWQVLWPAIRAAGIEAPEDLDTRAGRTTLLDALHSIVIERPGDLGGSPEWVARRLSDLAWLLIRAGVRTESVADLKSAWSSKGRRAQGRGIVAAWARVTGWVDDDSTGYTMEHLATLLDALDQRADGSRAMTRLRAFVHLATSAGLRISEACSIRVEDVNSNRFAFTRSKGLDVPVRDSRPMPRQAWPAVQAWLDMTLSDGNLFAGDSVMGRTLSAVMKEIGLPPMTTSANGRQTWGLHGFRHTFASASIEAGHTGAQTSLAMGHNDPSSLQHYVDKQTRQAAGDTLTIDHGARIAEVRGRLIHWDGTLGHEWFEEMQGPEPVPTPSKQSMLGRGRVVLDDGSEAFIGRANVFMGRGHSVFESPDGLWSAKVCVPLWAEESEEDHTRAVGQAIIHFDGGDAFAIQMARWGDTDGDRRLIQSPLSERRLQDSNLSPASVETELLKAITAGAADVRTALAEGRLDDVDAWLAEVDRVAGVVR